MCCAVCERGKPHAALSSSLLLSAPSPAKSKAESVSTHLTRIFPSFEPACPNTALLFESEDHPTWWWLWEPGGKEQEGWDVSAAAAVVELLRQPIITSRLFTVFIHPPGHATNSSPPTSSAHCKISNAELPISCARWVMPARICGSIRSICPSTSLGGKARRRRSKLLRTPLLPSRISGSSFGRMMLTGWGRGLWTGRALMAVVR